MFFEEKTDLVKQRFPQPEFKDPFREGKEIVEKIIRRFHSSSPLRFFQSADRVALLNNSLMIRLCSIDKFYNDELNKLEPAVNYWLFLVTYGFKVYDCRKEPLRYLLYLLSGQKKQEFYIVDKKYLWAVYVKLDTEKDSVEIYKSGNTSTVFD